MKRHLLVIGNSNYDEEAEFPRIPYSVADTSKVFTLLTRRRTSLFSSETSVCRQNVTRAEFEDALQEFFGRVDKADLVMVYFAGHARKLAGRLFLVMKNSRPRALASTAFNTESLQPYLEEKQISRYIVVLDCCQAAQAFRSPGVRTRGIIADTSLESLSGCGKIYLASAREYELAHELESLGHGLFSHYFIDGIETGQAVDRSERFISITDICNYVRAKLQELHHDIAQEPVMSGQDFGGELVIAENPRFVPTDQQQTQILEAVKKTLKLSDLSDAEELERARLGNLRRFMDLLADFNVDLIQATMIVQEHGEALGLDPVSVKNEFDAYVNTLKFKEADVSPDTLAKYHGKGLAILASSTATQPAYEIQEFKSGLFSYFLREALLGRASNADGIVTLSGAFQYVRSAFEAYQSVRQDPALHSIQLQEDPILTGSHVDWNKSVGTRVALIAGTNEVIDPDIHPLQYAESDAESMATVLQDIGGFDCQLLMGSAASSVEVKRAVSTILARLNRNDTFLFYFTGNGFLAEDHTFSLVLSDFDRRHIQWLPISYLRREIDASLVGTVIIILDTCFAGASAGAFQ